jgi:uncharacterized membrane protein YbhN (UPF0104 family)
MSLDQVPETESERLPPVRNLVFAAPHDDPRARRPADIVVFCVSVLVVVLAGWAHWGGSDLDRRVVEFFAGGVPGFISGLLTMAYILGGLYPLTLIVTIAIFGGGRGAVARDMVLAGALAGVAMIVASLVASSEWPDIIPELLERGGTPSFPVTRLALAVAAQRVSAPYLSVPMRRLGRRLVFPMALAAIVLGYGTVSAVIGGLAVGVGSAAAVQMVFGSGVGIPSKGRIVDAFASSAVLLDPDSLTYLDEQPIGATLVRARLDTGREVLVKVYGRDASDAAAARRLWRSLWYRGDESALVASAMQLVEHESLMLLEAARSGVPVPELAGWGRGEAGDAVIATEWITGDRMASLAPDEIGDETLVLCWQAVDQLARAGIVHRGIDRTRLVIHDDRVILDDLSASLIAADRYAHSADVAQMLVALTLAVGADRAITSARAVIGDDRLAETLHVLQRSALPSSLQHDVKDSKLSLKDLRAQLADELDTELPQLVQLARVTWGHVAMVALTFFAAYALLASLADIGLDAIADEVADARWSWVVVALILAQLTNVGEYISLSGMVDRPVPLGPTLMLRYAISFMSLALPSEAGAIALNIRYMVRLGVSSAAAAAQGPLLTIVAKGLDLILLIITSRIIGQTIELDDVDSGPVLRLLILIVVLGVVGIVVTLAVPKFRRLVFPPIKDAVAAVRGSITSLDRLTRIVGGSMLSRVLFAMTLAASVGAYGGSISFGEAVFVNSAVSLLVGLMPVPGGIGVGEAALAAGLATVGVPEGAALAAAVTHRMATTYLPPVFGWYATRWLTARDYL